MNQSEYVGLLSPSAGVRIAIHNAFEAPFPESNVSLKLTQKIIQQRFENFLRTGLK